jgi:hypothetical protein
METIPEHMQNTTSPAVQVVLGLIFAVFLAAMIWGSVNYLPNFL